MKKAILFLALISGSCTSWAQIDKGGHDPVSQFRYVQCDERPAESCFAMVSSGYPSDSSKPKQRLSGNDFVILQSSMKRYPDLDWSSVIDSSKATGETLLGLINKKNVQISSDLYKTIEYYSKTKAILSPKQEAEKAKAYMDGMVAYSKADPGFVASLSIEPSRAADFQKKFDQATGYKAPSNPNDITCSWNAGQPNIIRPLPSAKCGDQTKKTCLGQGTCRTGKSLPFSTEISCTLSNNEPCDATACAKSETGVGTKGCGLTVERESTIGQGVLKSRSEGFLTNPNSSGVGQ